MVPLIFGNSHIAFDHEASHDVLGPRPPSKPGAPMPATTPQAEAMTTAKPMRKSSQIPGLLIRNFN